MIFIHIRLPGQQNGKIGKRNVTQARQKPGEHPDINGCLTRETLTIIFEEGGCLTGFDQPVKFSTVTRRGFNKTF